jgi:filamentous hemagglutinin family protein
MDRATRQQLQKLGLVIVLAISGVMTTLANSARAQIVPDSTLGAESTKLTPNTNVQGLPATLIEGGASRGVNLFQSFLQFNVGDGQRVYFANPVGIENILTRVTGSDPSKIFGTLGVDGRANLFFLNPNGIIFGPNARLDVAGSFLATTANSFVFENGLKFSATNPEAAPLLIVSLRPGLQFGSHPSASISNTGNLSVGQDLTLVGGNLDLQGKLQAGRDLILEAQHTVKVTDTATNPFIAAAGGKLLLQGNQSIDIFALNHPESGLFSGGDMVLRSANTVGGDAHYWAGGNFRIEKLDGNLGNLSSPDDPIIRASRDVSFDSYEGASLHILAGGSVNINSITITGADTTHPTNSITENVPLSTSLPDGTNSVAINGGGEPTLDIRAGTTAFGTPGLRPNPIPGVTDIVNPNAPPTSADINIGTIENLNYSLTNEPVKGKILLTNQYAPNQLPGKITTNLTESFGDVTIDSRGDIETKGTIDVSFGIDSNNNIQFIANKNILVGGDLLSDSYSGNGGNITLISKNGGIDTRAGAIVSRAFDGVSGDVNLQATGDIYLGNIEASSFDGGRGGNINIMAGGLLTLDNVFVRSETYGYGNAGNIDVAAQSVFLNNGAQLRSISYGSGNSGNITVKAQDILSLTGNGDLDEPPTPSAIFTLANLYSTGNGGDINITTNSLVMRDGSEILANNFGEGTDTRAGDITIRATGKISLDGFRVRENDIPVTGIASNVSFAGHGKQGGTIDIEAAALDLTNSGSIASNLERGANGQGGNIKLNIGGDILISGVGQAGPSGIFALTQPTSVGDGGTIEVQAGGTISLRDRAEIKTDNNGSGVAGSIKITAGDKLSIENSSVTSESNYNDESELYSTIDIAATRGSVFLNQARLSTTNFGLGYAGDISISARDEISIINSSNTPDQPESEKKGIFSNGNLGNIFIGFYQEDASLIPKKVTIDHSFLSTSNQVEGNNRENILTKDAGDIIVHSLGDLFLTSSNLETATYGSGAGGDIYFEANSVSLSNQSSLLANTLGTGKAGGVTVNTTGGSVSLSESSINTGSNEITLDSEILSSKEEQGGGGDISITTASLFLTQNSILNVSTFGSENSGNIYIAADKTVSFTDSSIVNARTYLRGNAGNVNIKTQNLLFSNESLIQAETLGSGNAGNLDLTAEFFYLSNTSRLDAQTFGSGNAGNVDIKTQMLSLTEGSRINADSFGSGKGGNITINPLNDQSQASAAVNISGVASFNKFSSGLFVNTESEKPDAGPGGNISIKTGNLNISDAGVLSAPSKSSGSGGNIEINVNNLAITSGGQIVTNAYRSGQAGSIKITASNNISIAGQNLEYEQRLNELKLSLNLLKDSYDILVAKNDPETTGILDTLSNFINNLNGLLENTEVNSSGESELLNIDLIASALQNSDYNQLLNELKKQFEQFKDSYEVMIAENNQEIIQLVEPINNLINNLNGLEQITISPEDPAYNQQFNALIEELDKLQESYSFLIPENDSEARRILGPINQYSGLFANTEVDSTGQGGTIDIASGQATIQDSARISVDSKGTGVAGSISISANRLTLDNKAAITADTNSGQGGSITLNLQDLLLFRRQSVVSTTAGRQGTGGDGGAIAINLDANKGFIVSPALENNDIVANAFSGSGGTIEINAKGVIGLATLTRQELEQKLGTTDPDKLDPQFLQTNDITAISQTNPQLNGIVSISSPDIDPSKGIASLPTNAIDPSQQIAQSCGAGSEKVASAFTDAGRGGLPPKPDEFLSSDTVWEDIRLRTSNTQQTNVTPTATATPTKQKTVLIMPATGWVFNNRGEVTLVSHTPKSSAAWLNSSNCAVKGNN